MNLIVEVREEGKESVTGSTDAELVPFIRAPAAWLGLWRKSWSLV